MTSPRSLCLAATIVWMVAMGMLAATPSASASGNSWVGNMVFLDTNGNSHYDMGEGVPNVEVKLFHSGDDPTTAIPVQETITGTDGKYLFFFLDEGDYFIFIPATEFQPTGDLTGTISVPGVGSLSSDDDVGEDGIDNFDPSANGIRSLDFNLTAGQAPDATSGETGFEADWDDAFAENDINLTIDLGFIRPVGIGNLIFVDSNGNGHADPGEGVPEVTVRLFRSGDDPLSAVPVAEITTDVQGEFSFTEIGEGSYFVHVPPLEFGAGRPLNGASVLVGGSAGDDDSGSNSIANGSPAVNGVSSNVVTLLAGQQPTDATTETGVSAANDNYADADIDMTIDLGFSLPSNSVGVGNFVFIDADANGHGDLNEGVDEVKVQLFHEGDDPQSDPAFAEQMTANGGLYYFGGIPAGNYFVHIPASEFAVDKPLQGMGSLPGADNGFFDDDAGEDGVDTDEPASVVGVSSNVFTLSPGTEPTVSTIETGVSSYIDDFVDGSADLTVDFGFMVAAVPTMSLGNLVFSDANNNGHFDSGEGVSGVTVQLFRGVDVPGINSPQATTTTSANGAYLFSNLTTGSYYVRIPPSQFMIGGPLHGKQSIPGQGSDDGTDDNANEDGIDAADLDVNGINSIVVSLGNNQEPVNSGTETGFDAASDDADDNNTDLTIDLGFQSLPPPVMKVGNLVYFDANNNGKADSGEGVDGVTVQLFPKTANPLSDPPLASTITANGGQYLFTTVEGEYIAFIPPTMFQAGGPLEGKVSMTGVGSDVGFDDHLEEDGIDNPAPEVLGIRTHSFNLQANLEPVNSGNEKGLFATLDDADDNNGDMTIDFGFVLNCPTITISPETLPAGATDNAYGQLFTAEGGTAPYTWSKTGTLPPGITLDAETGALAGTPTTPGTWSFTVRTIDAAGCSVTKGYSLQIVVSMKVGNLVYHDANWNGLFDTNEGVSGVTVEIYHSGDIPGVVSPVKTTTTSSGLYMISGLTPGDFFLHVPASMFQSGAPLFGMASLPGVSANNDDDYGEDGEDAVTPSSTGVSTAVFTLAPNTEPTDGTYESGQHATDDNADDANGNMTLDFAFRAPEKPSTFVAWQAQNTLGGANGPTDNPDGDGSSNLLEYATCLPADSGLSATSAFKLTHNIALFRFDGEFSRRLGAPQDVNYTLEGSLDPTLAGASWSPLSIAPEVTNNADGTERVVYKNIAGDAFFSGQSGGFIRLRVDLDANHDLTPEATSYSPAWGWAAVPFQVLPQTLSLPLSNGDVFSGTVTNVAGNSLDISGSIGTGNLVSALQAGYEYYVEVTDGTNEGHRFEVTEASCTANTIVLDPAQLRSTLTSVPSTLTGAPITLRKHWRAKDALPPAAFHSTNNSATADRLLFYDSAAGNYKTLWLFTNSGNPKWVLQGDSNLGDAGTRVINATEGFFVNPRFATTTVPVYGMVRRNDCACPLVLGMNFTGGFWSLAQSPADRAMSVAGGFAGASNVTNADRVRVWNADTVGGSQTYTGYYLLKTPSLERWVQEGDSNITDKSATQIFTLYRGAFIQCKAARPLWKPLLTRHSLISNTLTRTPTPHELDEQETHTPRHRAAESPPLVRLPRARHFVVQRRWR